MNETQNTKTKFCVITIAKLYIYSWFVIAQCITGTREETDFAYNECLKWNKNETTLTLSCIAPTLPSKLTIYHEKGKINVICNLETNLLSCNPENKTEVYYEAGQVEVVFHESTTIKDLSGKWYCQWNENGPKLKAEVYLSHRGGIINDTWIRINTTFIKSKEERKLLIECSSCRKSHRSIAYFIINETENNPVWWNSSAGACIFGHIPCQPERCSCSASGNRFILSHEIPKNGTTIECEMQFEDNKWNFVMNANGTFNGADFTEVSTHVHPSKIHRNPPVLTTALKPNHNDDYDDLEKDMNNNHKSNSSVIMSKINDTCSTCETNCRTEIVLFSFGGYIFPVIVMMVMFAHRRQLCSDETKRFYLPANQLLKSSKITLCRTIAFIFFSCLYFLPCWFLSSIIEVCQFSQKWIFLLPGFLFGIVSSCLCLNTVKMNDEDSQPNTNPDGLDDNNEAAQDENCPLNTDREAESEV